MSIYSEAINVLDTDGWCQGSYTNSDGAHCMVGALYVAATGVGRPQYDDQGMLVIDVARDLTSMLRDRGEVMTWAEANAWYAENEGEVYPSTNAITWNDHRGRDVDQVKALLQEAHDAQSAA